MAQQQEQKTIPFEFLEQYLVFLATSSPYKQDAMLRLLAQDNIHFYANDVEGVAGFKEPESDDVELMAWMKAMVGLALMKHLTKEQLEDNDINTDPNSPLIPREIDRGNKVEAISLAGDVATAYATDYFDFFDAEKSGAVHDFHSLKRKITSGMDGEEISRILEEDKKEWSEKYGKPFWIRFRVGTAAVSSDGKINNSVKAEFFVHFHPLPQESVIDSAYEDIETVKKVGPRVNLAYLTTPEYVQSIIMLDCVTGYRRKLSADEYGIVQHAVIGAVLPLEFYHNLFKPQKGPNRIRQ